MVPGTMVPMVPGTLARLGPPAPEGRTITLSYAPRTESNPVWPKNHWTHAWNAPDVVPGTEVGPDAGCWPASPREPDGSPDTRMSSLDIPAPEAPGKPAPAPPEGRTITLSYAPRTESNPVWPKSHANHELRAPDACADCAQASSMGPASSPASWPPGISVPTSPSGASTESEPSPATGRTITLSYAPRTESNPVWPKNHANHELRAPDACAGR